MKRILLSVGGGFVSALAVTAEGQANGTGMGNRPGRSLKDAILELNAADVLLLVEDAVFGTGFHRVTEYHGAGGVGYGFNLHVVMTRDEAVAIHDAMVADCRRGETVGRSPLAQAFDRLAAVK